MMKQTIVLRIAIPMPLRQLYDYLPPVNYPVNNLCPGLRVKIPFQNREVVGIIVELIEQPDIAWDKLKACIAIIDQTPVIDSDISALCYWAADYYHSPLGEVLLGTLPTLLRKGKDAAQKIHSGHWKLTDQAKLLADEDGAVKIKPKQRQLIRFLLQFPNGVTEKELRTEGFSKTILNAAKKQQWIELITNQVTVENLVLQPDLPLNAAQMKAVIRIQSLKNAFHVVLLDGITGSGKTEVYLQAINDYIKEDKQILILVPEIGLTPQTIQRFRERFSISVIALHSKLSEKERLSAWLAAKNKEAKIIIGTRSALFTPFADLGLIIVDEEHDVSFKQQEGFRYHARDLAIMRAFFNKVPIILGSATPSLETLHNVQLQRYHYVSLPERAGNARLPHISIVDICKLPLEQGLSQPVLTEIERCLAQGEQAMLFLNRRGFAPVLICHSCGWMASCKRCDARMTFHKQTNLLHCHHCDSRKPLAKQCAHCQDKNLYAIGTGTERLEEILQHYFPKATIVRIDRDSTQKKGSLETLLTDIQKNKYQILIGTQMLAKGHHFPNVTLAVIVDADGGFFSTDFRALERMGQLIMQVSGRAGRAEKEGKVLIQTHYPSHPLLQQLLHENYLAFATSLLSERKQTLLPPYVFFALFRAEAYDIDQATNFLRAIKNLADKFDKTIRILGPVCAPKPRRAGHYRMQLLLQSPLRASLNTMLKNIILEIKKFPNKHRIRWSLDVDPVEMF